MSLPQDELAFMRQGPFLDLLGMKPELIARGRVRVVYEVRHDHLRSRSIVHGGVLATLMDTALGFAASSLAPQGFDVVTAQLNVNFIRPAREGEILVAHAEVKHGGRKTAVVWAEASTQAGELVVTGSATLMYIPISDLKPPGSEPS